MLFIKNYATPLGFWYGTQSWKLEKLCYLREKLMNNSKIS